MESIRLEDILEYKFLSEPRFSPDGKRAAFVVSNANEEENSYESRLWLWDGSRLKQMTDLGKERGYAWLDSERLIFPAVRSEDEKKRAETKEEFTSYYVLDVTGGEAVRLFTLPFAASGLRVLDPAHFAVTGSVDKQFPELWKGDKDDIEAARKQREEDKDYKVFDELPFWSNGEGVTNGRRSELFMVSLEPFSVEPVTALPDELQGLTVLGNEIFYAVGERKPKASLFGFTLCAYNWLTGEGRELVKCPDLMFNGIEPIGDRLCLLASDGRHSGLNENSWSYCVDPQSGEMDVLRAEDQNMYSSVGSDVRLGGGREIVSADGFIYHLTTREGCSYLYRLGLEGEDEPVITREGCMDYFDICGGKVFAVGLYDMRPQEIYLFDVESGDCDRLSAFNDEAIEGRYIAQPEPVSVISLGLHIDGWVLPPKDFEPEKTYPAVFDIHGGPKTVYGPVFYHEMQAWASAGYFVFFCNPKGSDGRGNDFADIRGEYGDTDYVNLMDFADAVLEFYPQIDPERICETGGSYGGFMTNWIIGHTDRFCCAASQRSISNWLSFYGISDIGFFFAADQTAGDPYTNPAKLWAQSPLKYASNVKTPTLFIHSDEDYRCPLDQGLQMYAALADRGIETRLCLFHGENHELSRSGKPKHRLRRLREITDWFEKHAK